MKDPNPKTQPYIVNPTDLENWKLHEGVDAKVVVNGEKMTSLYAVWQPHTVFAVHSHPHEQLGLCLEGEVVFTIDGQEYLVKAGDFYYIPSSVPHAERNDGDVQAILVDVFAPVRDDLLRKRFEQKIYD
jgi:quercetin dioxygenase-like cupin family protein